MAIAFDAFSNVAEGTGTLSWTHTPVGIPSGVLVFIIENSTTSDGVITVTYGGTEMVEVSGSPNILATGETGVVHCFFLGSSVPNSGPQTVTVNVSGSIARRAGAITLTADVDTEVIDSNVTINSTSISNPSIVLDLIGQVSFAAIAFHSGRQSIDDITPLTNWTARLEHSFGAQVAGWYTYDIIGSTDVTAGWTQSDDDAVAIAIAINEINVLEGRPLSISGIKDSDKTMSGVKDSINFSGSKNVSRAISGKRILTSS